MLVRELTQRRYAKTIAIRGPDDITALPACKKLKRAKRAMAMFSPVFAMACATICDTVTAGSRTDGWSSRQNWL